MPELDLSQITITGAQQQAPQPKEQLPLDISEVSITGAPPEEGWAGWVGRNIASGGKSFIQGLFGGTGELREAGKSIGIQQQPGLGGALGAGAQKLAESVGLEEYAPTIGKVAEAGFDIATGPATAALKYAPTGEQIGKGIETASEAVFGVSPDYFKPTGKMEELLQSSSEDLGSFLPFVLGGVVGAAPAVARSIVPNISAQAAKGLGFGEGAQQATKLITQLGMGIFGSYNPKKTARAAYTAFEESIPKGQIAETKNSSAPLRKIQKYLRGGVSTRSKEFIGKKMNELYFLEKENADLARMFQVKNDLGEILRDPKTPFKAKAFLGPLRKGIVSDIKKGAATIGKDALGSFNFAEGVTKAMHQSIKPVQFIKDKLAGNKALAPLSYATGALLGLVTGGTAGAALKGAAGALGAGGLLKVADTIFTTPQMWKLYGNVMTQAAKENIPLTIKAIKRLDKAIRKKNPELAG